MLGFSEQDFLQCKIHLRDRVHREDSALADSLFSSDLTKSSGNFNIRVRHADGKIRCIRGHLKKGSHAEGRVQLELQLADARTVKEPGDESLIASFKSLIEQTTDYIYIKNRNHVILAASQTLSNLIELNGGTIDLVGTTDYDNHPEETADTYYRLEEKAFAEGRRVNQIQQVPAKNGMKRWIDNRKYPINGPDGEIIGIFGVAPDITEYIEAQKRLRESEERLGEAEKIAGIGSYLLDIPRMQWTVSPAVAKFVGSRSERVTAFDEMWAYIHPDDRGWVAKRFEGYFRGEGCRLTWSTAFVAPQTDETRWIHTRGRLEFDADGQPVTLRGTIQDITERKQGQEALKREQRFAPAFCRARAGSAGNVRSRNALPGSQPAMGRYAFPSGP